MSSNVGGLLQDAFALHFVFLRADYQVCETGLGDQQRDTS